MSRTTDYRYEVSAPGYGVIEHVRKMDEAKGIASRWITRENAKLSADDPMKSVEIFDRMARVGKPQLWTVTACTGEAHSNPWIDHCGVCMPEWGIVVRVKERKVASNG